MARIRSVKPSLRTSEVVRQWPWPVRYFWVLLWGYLDDLGRGLDIPKAIAGDCFPLDDDVTPAKVNRWLGIMSSTKAEDKDAPVCRYEVDGRRYLHAVYWSEHQRPNRPSPSQHPPCPIHEQLPEEVAAAAEASLDAVSSTREEGDGGRLKKPPPVLAEAKTNVGSPEKLSRRRDLDAGPRKIKPSGGSRRIRAPDDG